MSTVPVGSAGAVALMVVELTTVYDAGWPVPKLTAVTPLKLVPFTVTEMPPEVGPNPGLTPVTVTLNMSRRSSCSRTGMKRQNLVLESLLLRRLVRKAMVAIPWRVEIGRR